MKLPVIPQDKANHAVYGVAIYVAVASLLTIVASLLGVQSVSLQVLCSLAGVAAAAAVGMWKEHRDSLAEPAGVAHASAADAAWTAVAAAVASAPAIIGGIVL